MSMNIIINKKKIESILINENYVEENLQKIIKIYYIQCYYILIQLKKIIIGLR